MSNELSSRFNKVSVSSATPISTEPVDQQVVRDIGRMSRLANRLGALLSIAATWSLRELRMTTIAARNQLRRFAAWLMAEGRLHLAVRREWQTKVRCGEEIFTRGLGDAAVRESLKTLVEQEANAKSLWFVKWQHRHERRRLLASIADRTPTDSTTATREQFDHDSAVTALVQARVAATNRRQELMPTALPDVIRVVAALALSILVFLGTASFFAARVAGDARPLLHAQRPIQIDHRNGLAPPSPPADSSKRTSVASGVVAVVDLESEMVAASYEAPYGGPALKRNGKSAGNGKYLPWDQIEDFIQFGHVDRNRQLHSKDDQVRTKADSQLSKHRQYLNAQIFGLVGQPILLRSDRRVESGKLHVGCRIGLRLSALPRDIDPKAIHGPLKGITLQRVDSAPTSYLASNGKLQDFQSPTDRERAEGDGRVVYHEDTVTTTIWLSLDLSKASAREIADNTADHVMDFVLGNVKYQSTTTWGAYRKDILEMRHWDCDAIRRSFRVGENGDQRAPDFFRYQQSAPRHYAGAELLEVRFRKVNGGVMASVKNDPDGRTFHLPTRKVWNSD